MNPILMTVIILSNNVVEVFIILRFCEGIFEKRKLDKYNRIIAIVLIVAISVFINVTIKNAFILTFIDFIVNILIAHIFFFAENRQKVIISVFLLIFSIVSELLTAVVFSTVFGQVIKDVRNDGSHLFIGSIISSIILLLLVEGVIRYMNRSNFLVSIRSWILIVSIPLVSIFLSVISLYNPVMNNELGYVSFIICLAILYINIVTFHLFDHIAQQIEENNNYRLKHEQMILEQEQYKSIMTTYDQVRQVKHDMNNHLILIDRYIKEGQFDKFQSYMDKLSNEAGFSSDSIISNNIVIDALLNHKIALARQSSIEIRYNVIIPKKMNIDDMDLCTVIGNILNNAIEGCNRLNDNSVKKIIYVNINYKNAHLLISVRNPYESKSITRRKGIFLSSKGIRDGQYYGLGINNVERIARRYEGVTNIETDENFFSIKVMLADKKRTKNVTMS